jgi:hypothetical protein
VQRLEKRLRKNWKKLDERLYIKTLGRSLPPLRRPLTKTALDTYTREVTSAIQNAISKAVPDTLPSSHARAGWTEECRTVLAEAKRLKRVHSQHHTAETWEAYRAARNHKARTIHKALRKAHRDRIEQAAESPDALWKLARWARTRHNQSTGSIPQIQHPDTQRELDDPAEKAELFRDVFFPTPPEADLEDITSPARKRETPLSEMDSPSSHLKYPHTHLDTCKESKLLPYLPIFRVMQSSRKITVVLMRPAFILRTALATTLPSTFTLSLNLYLFRLLSTQLIGLALMHIALVYKDNQALIV